MSIEYGMSIEYTHTLHASHIDIRCNIYIYHIYIPV